LKVKVFFLYSEIAEYFLAGIESLVKKNIEIHIVKWQTNKEAPFNFRKIESVTFYDRNNYSNLQLLKLIQHVSPQAIIASGWVDKGYLKACSYFKNKIPIVLTMDNHWEGTTKQKLATFLSPFFLKNKFSHVWVPGKYQKEYALKLGFNPDKIYQGFYSADTQLFNKYYNQYKDQKEKAFPKKFLFVGRYIKAKAISLLWEAFVELQDTTPNDWELLCVGTGELFPKKIKHPKIKHLGFVQPKDMGKIIAETSVFVLPSNFEPWGVVVHEYTAAGFPLICSNKIGAASMFLEDGENGFSFKSNDKESLKTALKKIMNSSSNNLIKMGEISRKKSDQLSPEKWANTVLEILNLKL